MRGRPPEVNRRRKQFVEALDELQSLITDGQQLVDTGGLWEHHQWKLHALFEMLAVRLYTEWERFSHDLLILWLAKDTTALAEETELTITPKNITRDMAEALLTSRGYLEFRDTSKLKGSARKWLVDSPFEALTKQDEAAADELRSIRNYVVHRSRQSAQAYRRVLKRRHIKGEPLPGQYLAGGQPPRLRQHLATLRAAAVRLF